METLNFTVTYLHELTIVITVNYKLNPNPNRNYSKLLIHITQNTFELYTMELHHLKIVFILRCHCCSVIIHLSFEQY